MRGEGACCRGSGEGGAEEGGRVGGVLGRGWRRFDALCGVGHVGGWRGVVVCCKGVSEGGVGGVGTEVEELR